MLLATSAAYLEALTAMRRGCDDALAVAVPVLAGGAIVNRLGRERQELSISEATAGDRFDFCRN